jgi:hypothetical protein
MTDIQARAEVEPLPDLSDNEQRFLAFVVERHAIYERRKAGQPEPWTTDPILGEWRFCNVYRELDRVTKWIRENWRDPHKDDPDVWFSMVVARFVNWSDTLAEIGYPVPWDPDRFLEVMGRRRQAGEQVWTNAYMVAAGPIQGQPKAVYYAELFSHMWETRERIRPKPGESLDSWHARLLEYKGFDNFMAAQVVADVKFTKLLESARDWVRFAASGPGSGPGMNRIHGRAPKSRSREDDWRLELARLRAKLNPHFESHSLPSISAHDAQNCLCEWQKYERERLGEGHPRQRFRPYGEATRKPRRPTPTPAAERELPLRAGAGVSPPLDEQATAPAPAPAASPAPQQPKGESKMSENKTARAAAAEEAAAPFESVTPVAGVPDPFDLESLALGQGFAESLGVKKLLKTIPARRPNPQDFVRVHPNPDYRRNLLCVELKEDRESYLVRPEVAPELVGETVVKTFFTAITRQGVVFFWPVTVPPPDAKANEWWRSSREAAELAIVHWIRMKANMNLGAYEMFEAEGQIPEPEWPSLSYQELLRIGFRDRMIDRVDHPVIRRLRGLA